MIEGIITVKPHITVKQALEIFEINGIRNLPVVDDNGKLLGIFGLKNVFKRLLPASVTMEDGLKRLDFVIGAAPGIAKRLKKLYPLSIEEVMEKNPIVLHPDTATWEALRVMAVNGSPICIVNEHTGVFVGMISYQSMLGDLHHVMEEIEREEAEQGE